MKIILGIDAKGDYSPAMCFLHRLKVPQPQVTLVHAADTNLPMPSFGAFEASQVASYSNAMENIGRDALDRAVDDACNHHMKPKTLLMFGSPAASLIAAAESEKAELVAVRATHEGRWSHTFLGSISRALALGCPTNVLIVKGDEAPKHDGYTVVFATDHSPYADRALDRFLSMGLQGVSTIHVVSAINLNEWTSDVLNRALPMLDGKVNEHVREEVEARNAAVLEKIRRAGYAASAQILFNDPNTAIHEAMRTTKADFLVIGAQGHGFFERVLVGSVALHQVVAEEYSVMLIRA
jgi:nucleotide-binding universal stress UspA family protein